MITTRRVIRKKIATPSEETVSTTSSLPRTSSLISSVSKLVSELTELRDNIVSLEKTIAETRERWKKEQEEHARSLVERDQQEDISQKREEETYQYETKLTRKRTEDEFAERKAKWERDLADQKEQLAKEKEELALLRKQVASFEDEKDKLRQTVTLSVQKEITATFTTERKLREQEVKAEKDLLMMKITMLTTDSQRINQEITRLKNAYDAATREVKDIAVKVIDARRPAPPSEPQKQTPRE